MLRISSSFRSASCFVLLCASAGCSFGLQAAAPPAPVAASAQMQTLGPLRFAQITDAHIFDAGYKCSGIYVQREYEENLSALRWSIDEVNRRWKSGEKVDFVVFTGDLGIANIAGVPADHRTPDPKCSETDDAKSSYGPITQLDFATAEALLAGLLDSLPPGVPVYFLPGNNDLTDEDPGSIGRYYQLISGLKTLTHGRAVDLNEQSATLHGYTLVGLNSSGFKPQSYNNGGGGTLDENTLVRKGTIKSGGGTYYCNELADSGSGVRADAKAKAIQTFAGLVSGAGPYLVFTHEPDIQDPYAPRRQDADAVGGSCEFRSTWLLTESARTQWQASGLNNPNILGIFTGHFHSDTLTEYGGPRRNDAVSTVNAPTLAGGFVPMYVTPPLAVKLQWGSYPSGARGMTFVSVNNRQISAQIDPYWSQLGSDCCGNGHPEWVTKLLQAFRRHPDLAFVLAGALVLVLIAIVLLLASGLHVPLREPRKYRSGLHRFFLTIGERVAYCKTLLLGLLIEEDTKSYSLSKLQFLLWTVATIYGYTYLWVAHTLVQGLPGLPDVATQFPWEVSLSAGTTVASQISKRVVGTKGGGPLKPQLSDLISAGGSIMPGRLQFFSWTLVGVTAYLSSVLATDPCVVNALPTIPPQLLAVSGISSLAYLGARAVSPPGPILTLAKLERGGPVHPGEVPPPAPAGPVVVVTGPADAQVAVAVDPGPAPPISAKGDVLSIVGTDLSKRAIVTLYDANEQLVTGVRVASPPFEVNPKFAETGNPDFYTHLDVPVTGVSALGIYKLRLQNPDGKYAEVQVTT